MYYNILRPVNKLIIYFWLFSNKAMNGTNNVLKFVRKNILKKSREIAHFSELFFTLYFTV